jgi:hypothetical protein
MNAPDYTGIKESIGGADRYKSRNGSDSVKVVANEFGGWEALRKSILDPENAFKGNIATRFGEEHEDAACACAMRVLGFLEVQSQNRYITEIDGASYACTTDLFAPTAKTIIEVKCPFKGKAAKIWSSVQDRGDPSYYYWQVQHQMMVTGAENAFLFLYDPTDGAYAYTEISANEVHQRYIRERWDAFYLWLNSGEPDPNDGYSNRADDAWHYLAQSFVAQKKIVERETEILDQIKKDLIEAATSDKSRGAGVSVIKSERVGNVNYKSVPELKGVDLEKYRSKPIEVWTVSLTKEQK